MSFSAGQEVMFSNSNTSRSRSVGGSRCLKGTHSCLCAGRQKVGVFLRCADGQEVMFIVASYGTAFSLFSLTTKTVRFCPVCTLRLLSMDWSPLPVRTPKRHGPQCDADVRHRCNSAIQKRTGLLLTVAAVTKRRSNGPRAIM